MVAKDSDGEDSSGEPKRARFLDVFIARRLQTQEGMVGRCGKNHPVNSGEDFKYSTHPSINYLFLVKTARSASSTRINGRYGVHVEVHKLADHFGAVTLSLTCY